MGREENKKAIAAALTKVKLQEGQKVTASYQKALGKLTMDLSFLHFALERFGWVIWNLNGPMAQILTKDLQLKALATKLRASTDHAISEKEDRRIFLSILKRVENVAEQRNEFLHSLWLITEDEPVLCFSRKRGVLEGADAPTVDQINDLSLKINEVSIDFAEFKKRQEIRNLIKNFGAKAQRKE